MFLTELYDFPGYLIRQVLTSQQSPQLSHQGLLMLLAADLALRSQAGLSGEVFSRNDWHIPSIFDISTHAECVPLNLTANFQY